MEISRLCQECYIVICVIISPLVAKTFSINEALAENNLDLGLSKHQGVKQIDSIGKRISLNKILETKGFHITPQQYLDTDKNIDGKYVAIKKDFVNYSVLNKQKKNVKNTLPQGKHISPLKYRKAFQIDIPLKPKKLKYMIHKPKRKISSVKRDIKGITNYGYKYVPLIRSVGLLFNNLLDTGSSESSEHYNSKKYKYKSKFIPSEKVECLCSNNDKRPTIQISSTQEETTSTEASSFNITLYNETTSSETTTQATDSATVNNISTIGPNSYISLLPPRNSISNGRDNNGLSERSNAPFYWSSERNFARNFRDGEHVARREEVEAHNTRNYEKNTNNDSRNSSGSYRPSIRLRGGGIIQSKQTQPFGEIQESETKTSEYLGGESAEYNIKDKIEIKRNETENTQYIRDHKRGRLRGSLSENQEFNYTDPLQSIQYNAQSDDHVGQHLAHNQGIAIGNVTSTKDIQEIGPKDKTVANDLAMKLLHLNASNVNNSHKVVMIIDGYSVAKNMFTT